LRKDGTPEYVFWVKAGGRKLVVSEAECYQVKKSNEEIFYRTRQFQQAPAGPFCHSGT
jgi:hypothetical protein